MTVAEEWTLDLGRDERVGFVANSSKVPSSVGTKLPEREKCCISRLMTKKKRNLKREGR